MAKKSKGFRELLHQKQTRANYHQKALDTFEQRFQQSKMGSKFAGFVQDPKGEVKMSEVLKAFVKPYLEEIPDYQQEMFLQIAILAWNLAIMPEDMRQQAFEDLLKKGVKGKNPFARQDMRDFIDELIARKSELFPDNQRYIVDFQLKNAGNQFHLSVASTMTPPS